MIYMVDLQNWTAFLFSAQNWEENYFRVYQSEQNKRQNSKTKQNKSKKQTLDLFFPLHLLIIHVDRSEFHTEMTQPPWTSQKGNMTALFVVNWFCLVFFLPWCSGFGFCFDLLYFAFFWLSWGLFWSALALGKFINIVGDCLFTFPVFNITLP